MASVTPPSARCVPERLSLATLLATTTDPTAHIDTANELDYRVLKRRIQDAGLLEKRPAYYALSITTNLVLWTFCLVVLLTLESTRLQSLPPTITNTTFHMNNNTRLVGML